MKLIDNEIEFAFDGTEFTNIGEDDNCLFDSSNLSISFKGLCKSTDDFGAKFLGITLHVTNMRSEEIWLCYSLLLNNAESFSDDYMMLEQGQEREIDIFIEGYDIAYLNNRRAKFHFVLEDGRRRILGRCNSLCLDYNIFSGRYKYQNIYKFSKEQQKSYRELDIKVNKETIIRFTSLNSSLKLSYRYRHMIPIVITNCTERNRAFVIEELKVKGAIPEAVIGIEDLSDAISIGALESRELKIVLPDEHMLFKDRLFFDFIDIATNNRYVNAYTQNYDSGYDIDYSFVFIHDTFCPTVKK